MASQLPPVYYIVFTAVTALGVLLQAFVLLAIYIAIRRTIARLHEVTDELKQQVLPTIATARNLLEDVSPKLKVASSNLVAASQSLRHQANHASATVDELLDMTMVQAARVDEIVTAGIDSAAYAAQAVQHAFSVPVRQVSALVAALKAAFEVLRGRKQTPPADDDFGE
jgi:hypothetical protein